MKNTFLPTFAAACGLALGGASLSVAAQQAPAGNAEAARAKVAMCSGCHGIENYKTAFPYVYHVPKIAGQSPQYIVKSLQAYKSGERWHPSMQGIAKQLSDQDMADLAAYYASAK
jgi:cytochrome c553